MDRMNGAIAFVVSVDAPDATVRVNIRARESQIEKIDALAEAAGMTRSGYMVRAALMLFRWVVVQVLPEPSLNLCHAHPFAFAVVGDLITVDLAKAEIS